jgi:hypothetical protein
VEVRALLAVVVVAVVEQVACSRVLSRSPKELDTAPPWAVEELHNQEARELEELQAPTPSFITLLPTVEEQEVDITQDLHLNVRLVGPVEAWPTAMRVGV